MPRQSKAKTKTKAKTRVAAKTKKKEESELCLEPDCKQGATTEGRCRFHYLVSWKEKKELVQLKGEEKLNRYITQLIKKYPDRHLEILKRQIAETEDVLSLIRSIEETENVDDFSSEIDDETQAFLEKIKKEDN